MAQGLVSSRKRSRDNCETESCDFMPLPKKINSMHFGGSVYNSLVPQQVEHTSFKEGGLVEEWNDLQNKGNVCRPLTQSFEYSCAADQSKSNSVVINSDAASFHKMGSSCTSQVPASQEHPWMSAQILSQYTPDLTAADNPYYYENNKLLFALYMERMQRGGAPFY